MLAKTELIHTIAANVDISKKQAEEVLNVLLFAIEKALACGEDVRITRFGSFVVKERAARKGRDVRTGEEIIIPARRVVVFRPGKDLREVVSQ